MAVAAHEGATNLLADLTSLKTTNIFGTQHSSAHKREMKQLVGISPMF